MKIKFDYILGKMRESDKEAGSSGGVTPADISYADLLALKTGGAMTIGYYRITDFATSELIPNTTDVKTGITEPLIVLATSASTLDKQAYSVLWPQDYIEYDLVDTTVFNPSDGSSKGIISFRKDTIKNIYTYYDWRNFVWRRWETVVSNDTYLSLTNPGGGENYLDFYTFGNDIDVAGLVFTPAADGNTDVDTKEVFIQGGGAHNNIFGLACQLNTIGFENANNTISNSFYNNRAGNGFSDNIIALYCGPNTFGNSTNGNTLGGGLNNNIFGDNMNGNVIGNSCSLNIIDTSFGSNTIGNGFQNNNISQGFSSNVIDNTFIYNVIGVGFAFNNIGDDFSHNNIKSGFSFNIVVDNFNSNNVEDSSSQGVDYTSATHVYASYTCNIVRRVGSSTQLYYWTNTNVLTYAAPDA